jgi:hypothetical protein
MAKCREKGNLGEFGRTFGGGCEDERPWKDISGDVFSLSSTVQVLASQLTKKRRKARGAVDLGEDNQMAQKRRKIHSDGHKYSHNGSRCLSGNVKVLYYRCQTSGCPGTYRRSVKPDGETDEVMMKPHAADCHPTLTSTQVNTDLFGTSLSATQPPTPIRTPR